MKNFFELLGFLATAVLSGAAIFLYLGHAKNLPQKERTLAATYISDDGIEHDTDEATPAARPASQPRATAKRRAQLPDFEPIAAHPAGEIPAKAVKPKPASRAAEPSVLPKKAAAWPAEKPRAAELAKPRIALADAHAARRGDAKSHRSAAASEREKFEAAVPRAAGREATQTELNFREMVAKEHGFRSWSQLQRKASDAQKTRAMQHVKMLLATSRIR